MISRWVETNPNGPCYTEGHSTDSCGPHSSRREVAEMAVVEGGVYASWLCHEKR
jgi:hypothetical protein